MYLSTAQRGLLKRLLRGEAVALDKTHSATVDALIKRGLAQIEEREVTQRIPMVVRREQP